MVYFMGRILTSSIYFAIIGCRRMPVPMQEGLDGLTKNHIMRRASRKGSLNGGKNE